MSGTFKLEWPLGVEKEGTSLDGFSNQESNDSKHGDVAVCRLGLFGKTLKSLLICLFGKTKRIKEAHWSKGSGKVGDGEGV